MSSRTWAPNSPGERRPLALVDPDTTDYYDSGLPPPHRLSGMYSLPGGSSTSDSLHDQRRNPSGAASANGPVPVYNHFDRPSTPQRGPHYPNTVRENFYTPPSGLGNRPVSGQSFQSVYMNQDYSSSYSLSKSPSYNDGWMSGSNETHDKAGYYGGSPGFGASRDRYMARKQAQGSKGLAPGATFTSEKYDPRGHHNRGLFEGKRKWVWVGLALGVLLALGGVIGVVLYKQKKDGTKGVAGAVQSDSKDPSKFDKDPSLNLVFNSLCYTPQNAQYPACGDNLNAVIEDIQLMSQLTRRLRLYGSDCDVSSLVLQAIDKTKVNMTVFLAAWVPQPSDDPQNVTYSRQVDNVIQAIKDYGVDNIDGIAVGNEYLLNGGPEDQLIEKMAAMRTQLAGMNLPKTIPVGTADAGSMISEKLAAGSDFVMANVHAWFAGTTVEDAAGWVYEYTSTNTPSTALQAPNKPPLYIAETGWPSGANDTADMTYEGGVAGISELNTFMDTYVCQANANLTAGGDAAAFSNYFFFEAFDEPWKGPLYGGVEAYWGLLNSDKKLKPGLVLPNCTLA